MSVTPKIELEDRTPTEEHPHAHVHCSVCEKPYSRVALFSEPDPAGPMLNGETYQPQHMRVCWFCLSAAMQKFT